MRRKQILALCIISLALLMLVTPMTVQACYRPKFAPRLHMKPIVSTHWLNKHLGHPSLVILDVRIPDAYNDKDMGHIPGAINVPEDSWYINPPFASNASLVTWMEVPPTEDLVALIGDNGITPYSNVVVVGGTSGLLAPPLAYYSIAGITRVAMTLIYAGVQNVAILDGGYDKWIAEEKPHSTDPVTPTPVTYKGKVKKWMFVSLEYVESKIGKSTIVDARDEIVYNGTIIEEPWGPTPGHIPTAKNLPAPELWNVNVFTDEDGNKFSVFATYWDVYTLSKMARDVVGWRWRRCCREIIVYCGVGGYASTVFFVLSEVLGYRNVKVFDGSIQLWDLIGHRDMEI